MNKDGFSSLVCAAVEREALKRLVFSRPVAGEIAKISGRLVAHKGKRLLTLELSLPGNTVSHKNLHESEIFGQVRELLDEYKQVNLITVLGDAEYKIGKLGDVFLGAEALSRKLSGEAPVFESAIESLDRKKNYLLTGEERFLRALGISSADGRVHDKRQGKFRQINRFLEHIEDIYGTLPSVGELKIYDLCCGKSYLSFAVYYYLTEVKGRRVSMLGADLKRDVIQWCSALARELGYDGMRFLCADILTLELDFAPDMVISLHACDVATDIVLDTAAALGAKIILSTPCCHRYINGKITAPELSFITKYPHISNKLSEAVTDALRLMRLRAAGYSVSALELTDPENTPKNTFIKAIRDDGVTEAQRAAVREEYSATLNLLLGDGAKDYLSEFKGKI